ncbi:MAG: hypothetical protein AB4290_12025 [Spirulina sp.]
MISHRVSTAIALTGLVFPYCLAARAQIVPELETQPVSLTLPPPHKIIFLSIPNLLKLKKFRLTNP